MASTFRSRTSWREKLEKAQEPELVTIPPRMVPRFGRGTMLIPRPLDVDSLIRRVPREKLVTQSLIREKLARESRADVTCPITAGIFVRIAAEAAEEDARLGRKPISPYWRVVRDDGSLNEKFPGGPATQARRLQKEGFRVAPGQGSKPPRVSDFDKYLARL